MMYMIPLNDIFMIILSIICYITGLFCVIKGAENKNALKYYGIALIGVAASLNLGSAGYIVLQGLMRMIALICGSIFIRKTFYIDDLGKYRVYFYLIWILAIWDFLFHLIYMIGENTAYISVVKYINGLNFLVWGYWLYISTNHAYTLIEKQHIPPHVKKRYEYLKIISISLIGLAISNFFTDRLGLGSTHAVAQVFLAMFGYFYAIISSILWIMPDRVKKKIDGDFHFSDIEKLEQMSDEEVLGKFMEDS